MNNLISNCCGAKIYDDMDICQGCKEHCGAVDENDKEYEFAINQWVEKRLLCTKCGEPTLDEGQDSSMCGVCAN